MRSLFKNVANELIQQLTPEDLKEIMDSTIDTVLSKMSPDEQLAFSKDIVNNAVSKILVGFNEEQRINLLQALLPSILREIGQDLSQMEPDQIIALLRPRE
ncbi:MAG: hypothetical protein H0T73_03100 [Ardenticatenales bacterium]|nr:hypothetical protein [Ardenticatenales bacterium]